MKKIGVYFKTNYYPNEFRNENVYYNYNAKKIEIMDVDLIEFENGYLSITYKTTEYAVGEHTYNLDIKYIDHYYIF